MARPSLLERTPPVDEIQQKAVSAGEELTSSVRGLVQTLLRLVAAVPRLLSRVLGAVASLLHRLGDQSASLANLPTQSEQKERRRRTTLLVFGAGAVTGLGVGIAVGRATAPDATPDNVTQLHDRAS